MARTRRTGTAQDPSATAEKAVARFLSRHELRYILIEILIVATGVFIALAVDELRRTVARRNLTAETQSALRTEVVSNRSRMLLKMRLVHDAVMVLESRPQLAAELVRQRRNSLIVPFEAAWAFASQNDVLRYLPADERRRLTDAYVINAGYSELVHDEMTAWTELAGTAGADGSAAEVRERDKAVAVWLAYAQREALGSCIGLVFLQRALDERLANVEPRRICASYQAETDPSAIYQRLGTPMPKA